MYYKEDWPEARKRLGAFWRGEPCSRSCVGILAPRKTSKLPGFPHLTHGPWLGGLEKYTDNDREEVRKGWTDPEQNYTRMKLWFENTYFGVEAVPATYINWGVSAGCAFWGAEPQFNTKSVWFHKTIGDWESWSWTFNMESNRYWQNILAIMELFIERNDEEYFIGLPEIGNAADNLLLIRSATDLSLDLIMHPDAIKDAVEVMARSWVETHKILHAMSRKANQGGGILAWLNFWAPGSHDQVANDFSAMISTDTFREFFFPELAIMGNWLDYVTFHLDGPQCIQHHVDALLELDCIDCIQFTPGAGSPPTSNPANISIFQKILASGMIKRRSHPEKTNHIKQ